MPWTCITCKGPCDRRAQRCQPCCLNVAPPRLGTGASGIGRYTSKAGYVYRFGNGKKQLEHRAVMEQHLGHKLDKHLHVHHIDGDKSNNTLENLQVLTATEHDRLHMCSGKAKAMSVKGHAERWR